MHVSHYDTPPSSASFCCNISQIHTQVTLLVLTFNFLLSSGHSANSCIANVTVANVCIVVGRRDARHTDAKTEAFNDSDLDALKVVNVEKEYKYIAQVIRFQVKHY